MREKKENATEIIKAWAETIENAGYFAGIYMNQKNYRNDVKGLIKKYTKVCDEISAQLDMLLITTEVKYIPEK